MRLSTQFAARSATDSVAKSHDLGPTRRRGSGPLLCILNNPLHLNRHPLHSRLLEPLRTSITSNDSNTKTPTIRSNLQHGRPVVRASTSRSTSDGSETGTGDGAVNLSVKVRSVRVLGNELGQLDSGDELLVPCGRGSGADIQAKGIS